MKYVQKYKQLTTYIALAKQIFKNDGAHCGFRHFLYLQFFKKGLFISLNSLYWYVLPDITNKCVNLLSLIYKVLYLITKSVFNCRANKVHILKE